MVVLEYQLLVKNISYFTCPRVVDEEAMYNSDDNINMRCDENDDDDNII
jgi:hypothetical protein